MMDNVLITFLHLAGVKHTRSFSRQYFNEHPHKYNLYGLSSMLTDYGVENMGVKISDKDGIHSLYPPFIAHTGDDFVVVETIGDNDIRFIGRSQKANIPLEEFFKMWTGYVLIAEPDNNSKEPDYELHARKELFSTLQKIILVSAIVFLFTVAFISNKGYTQLGILSLLAINIIGGYIGYLLVLKQLHIHSDYADKLCFLFKHNDCNNILESDAAKFLGVIGWSEAGLGYFVSNLVILCFFPLLVPSLLLFNVLSLFYSFWSIWYQKFKAKQWCPLCLTVMLLLWAIFIIGMGFGHFQSFAINLLDLLFTGSIYLISILTINILAPVISKSRNTDNIRYEINSIKADEDVFKALLKKQPHYEVSKDTSRILLGNPDSNLLITVFSNPHCNPCSRMHERINKLLEQNGNICVQYIFSSFNEELEVSNKYLIGAYFQKNGESKMVYDEWFEKGKFDKEEFFRLHPVDIEMEEVIREFDSHKQWKEKSGLRATPTILVDGYKLPDNSKIEDIRYFTGDGI
ncbi:vitamin K epoxide reductase family protein [Proteiniphilum sp.]|uniref:vitamin K epoxide reductase family protein n=1 Tax=Proteiniphilum sp. TaxID=1926877 RepID=UPI002B1ED228|nr:vitamin K epoxide reductase family protein [Proteiniphilum sp.]MEA4918956.1 vitamin K epoxide reductase family protein [Proteiniphilum sp.]